MHNPKETHCVNCDIQLIHLPSGESMCLLCGHTPEEWLNIKSEKEFDGVYADDDD